MKMNARKWAVLAAAVVLAAAGIVAAVYSSAPRGNSVFASVKIEATKTGQYGVEPDSSFSITLDRAVDEDALRAMLRTEPELAYTLAGGGKRWTLVPVEALAENEVYTFRVVDETGAVVRSYAFQTKSGLLVETAYPRPGARWVELETGIEFTFNTVGVDMAEHFIIEPSVAGEFRATENTVIFVPNEPLLPDSIYRVTLKAGLTAANGMVLAEDYPLVFETVESDEKGRFEDLALLSSFDETFLPGDPVVLKLRGGDMTGAAMTLSVHRYADTQAYATELQKRADYYNGRSGVKREYEVQTQTMEPVTELTTELTPGDRWWSTSWAALPEGLPQGCYVLTLRGESPGGRAQFVQKLVQVCEVAAFAQAAEGDTLVWLNDAATGEPMAGARVQLQEASGAEQRAGVTDENGMLTLRTDEMENAWLSVTDGGRLAYFGALELSKANEAPLWQAYYSAVYRDRELYQPTDTVNFWGTLLKRGEAGAKLPNAVYAVLSQGGAESALYKTRVELLPDGTLQGSLSFTGLEAGWYSFMLTDGEDGVYWTGSIQVQQFTKPPLVITTQTDKTWYYAGDTVNVTFTANFYDGTPAAGAKLRFSCEELVEKQEPEQSEDENAPDENAKVLVGNEEYTPDDETQEGVVITLDAGGRGSYSAPVRADRPSWNPYSVYYSVVSADTQEVYLETTGRLTVAPSRYTCETTSPEDGKFMIKTNRLSEDAMNRAGSGDVNYNAQSEFERLSGAAAEVPITVEFGKTVWYQVPNGSYYDEINNKNVIRYRKEREETILRTETVRTVNGTAVLEYDPAWMTPEADTEYWVRVQFDGGLGNTMEETFYLSQRGGEEEDIRRYSFSTENFSQDGFPLGAQIPLALYENGKQVSNNGRVLYSCVAEGIRWSSLFTGNSASVPFEEDYIPNVAIAGAYFDGRHVFEISPCELRYDYGERTLEVQVQAGQETYTPGGEAELTVTLRDAAGKPVAGTACIGVVDESIFTLAEQNVDFVEQLYSNFRSTYVMQKSSYREYDLNVNPGTAGGMGGGGEGSGIALRSDFADTALFQIVAVDESGTATVKMKMPDNVTKWRATAAAITADGKAGDGKGSVIATLPFYVRAVVTDTYLVGDDLTVGALAVGTNLVQGGMVEYAAELLGEDGKQINQKTWQAVAGEQTYVSFGKQPEGQYKVRVTAMGNGDSDGVELPVTIAKTGAVANVMQRVELSELAGIKAERWPAVVDVYDVRLEPYMESLRVLSERSGERIEILAAAYRAQVMLNELLPEGERRDVPKNEGLSALQDYESGVKPLPNAEPEAAVTAKLLISAPQLVNGEFAKLYFWNVLKDPAATQDSRMMAYVGLAALHEPVMLDIARLLEDSSVTMAQRAYLGAGLAVLGDYDGAQAVYDGIVAGGGRAENGEAEQVRIQILGADENETQRNTGAALMLCSIIGHADANGLANELCAVMQEKPREDANVLTDLELLAYTRYFRFNIGEQASFRYMRDGKRETIELGTTGIKTLTLSAEAFAAADFEAGRGKVMANIRYTVATALPEIAQENSKVTVTKMVTPMGERFHAPGLARVDIRVSFAPGMPEGTYQVFDAIPSGMRYLPYTGNEIEARFDGSQVRMENEGQRMSGRVWLRYEDDGPMPLTQDAGAETAENPGMAASTAETMAASLEVENPVTADDPAQEAPVPEEVAGEGKDYVLTYYVSCSLTGGYVVESTYVTDSSGAVVAMTPRGTVEIG